MTAIWQNDGTGWRLSPPVGFPDEQTLHDLVEETPQILPLAGNPRLVVVGKEVGLGNGYADIVAVEPSGRLAVVVEIKLSRNAEARWEVVAQVLTYAAHLKGLSPEAVERDVLDRHLRDRGYESLQAAVASNDQEGSFDPTAFSEGLAECLSQGHFRLVLVLDEAPQELVTLVGYLEFVTEELLIDLIAVCPGCVPRTRAWSRSGTRVAHTSSSGAASSRGAPPRRYRASTASLLYRSDRATPPERSATSYSRLSPTPTGMRRPGKLAGSSR
jgi:hypothetical protein